MGGTVRFCAVMVLAASGVGAFGCQAGAAEECGPDATAEEDVPTLPPIEGVSYHRELRPIIEARCVRCHAQDGPAPQSLEDWERVERWRAHIVGLVGSRQMPPAQTDPSCRKMVGQHWLAEADRELFEQWASDGYLEGRPGDYEPPPAPDHDDPWDRGTPDVVVNMEEPFTFTEGAPEVFLQGLVDYRFEEDTRVVAVRVTPDHPSILHHLSLFLVDEDGRPLNPADDPEHAVTTGFIGGYSPGNPGFYLPEGAAFIVPAGSHLLADAHYHLQTGSAEDQPTADDPSIEMWFLPEGEMPSRLAKVLSPSVTSFEIPAGDPEYVVSAEVPMGDQPLEIVSVAPHMHYLGVAARMEIVRSDDPGTECVVDTPNYAFEWQLLHRLAPDHLVYVEPGDTARITCVYDNSAENQPFVDGVQQRPTDVRSGDSSLNEMCTMLTVVTYAL